MLVYITYVNSWTNITMLQNLTNAKTIIVALI